MCLLWLKQMICIKTLISLKSPLTNIERKYILNVYCIIPHHILITLLYICLMLLVYKGEGNGNPLQYSGLENPRDGGAWWAAVHGVAQSQTQQK